MDFNLFNTLVWVWIGIGLATFTYLLWSGTRAPYGRHTSENWGKTMDNKWGWFVMELPALIVFPTLVLFGPREMGNLSLILLVMWTLHYFNRAIIFPLRIRTRGKKIPLTIVLSAFIFNVINGFINGYWLGYLAPLDHPFFSSSVLVGLIIYTMGFILNQVSDHQLIGLRKKHTGYSIPKGGMFNYVSCPNHLGEIMEWIGFAVVAWSLPALSFALWTIFNLVPRAKNHHEWYLENFKDYPKNRKAVIPGLF